jgi:cellulose biosynthesis protein BcsQ
LTRDSDEAWWSSWFLAIAALIAADDVLVPAEAHVMALSGLASLVQTVERVRERLNPSLTVSAILACRVDARTNLARDVVEHLRERFRPAGPSDRDPRERPLGDGSRSIS